MSNILAYNPSTQKTVIVENMVATKDIPKALKFWREQMQFVQYYAKSNREFIQRHLK